MINYIDLIKSLVMPLVIYPEELEVTSLTSEDNTIILNVTVNEADLGRVIGKGGKIATAIRTICYAAASKDNEKVKVNIDYKK